MDHEVQDSSAAAPEEEEQGLVEVRCLRCEATLDMYEAPNRFCDDCAEDLEDVE